jgi:ribonuclease D
LTVRIVIAAAQECEQHERERAWRELKLGDRTAVPWREAAARWLTETKKRTKSKDEYMLAWFGGYLDNEPLSAIDRDTIEDLREGLREEGASESTVDRYMALLRAILRKARDEWRYIDNIPKVPMYGQEAPEPRWLRRDEFERLKRDLPPHLKLAAEFAVLTGLRMRSMLTFASWAVQGGVTLHELMQLGGWKSYAIVLRYGHLTPDHLSRAAELVAQKGHTARRKKAGKRAQSTEFTGGERGTRTLDLGIMKAGLWCI